jgi:hypothetical protein
LIIDPSKVDVAIAFFTKTNLSLKYKLILTGGERNLTLKSIPHFVIILFFSAVFET